MKRFEMLLHPDLLEAMDFHVRDGKNPSSNRSEFIRLAIVEKLEKLNMSYAKELINEYESVD